MPQVRAVEVTAQPSGLLFSPSAMGMIKLRGCWAWHQVPSPSELFCQPVPQGILEKCTHGRM